MKHVMSKAILAAVLMTASVTSVKAEDLSPDTDWTVTFDGKRLNDNFTEADFQDIIKGMQPGDTVTFEVDVRNQFDKEIKWWMKNDVLKSFEDSSIASGGAYTYRLAYTNAAGTENVIYYSDIVGGEDYKDNAELEGLHEATTALKEYFFLDSFKPNQTGKITIFVKLDGETQGNSYQDTVARLMLQFAVELNGIPKTGDEPMNPIWYWLSGGCGALILVLLYIRRKYGKEAE